MKDLPECLCRRYQALDELIEELTVLAAAQDHRCPHSQDPNDASIKILCEFWNILKEDPDCNLSKVVRQRMCKNKNTPRNFKPQRLACYSMAEHDADENNMKALPECLHRRYRALDELIEELTVLAAAQENRCPHSEDNDASIKILCEFWNILKEDPDCNLSRVVRQRLDVNKNTTRNFKPQRLACYAMAKHDEDDRDGKYCCGHGASEVQEEEESLQEETSKPTQFACCSSHPVSPTSTTGSPPLSKVLCDLKEAVSFDKKCNARIAELTKTQEELQEQIQQLEDREKEGTHLLKQAECMWSCMESAYKKKVKESLERQSDLLKQMKQVETSNSKWRKNKKDLELQLCNVDKCCLEIKEKLNQKNNDCKCIKMDIDNYKKRTSDSSKQLAACRCSFNKKKKASDLKIASFSSQISDAKEVTEKEKLYKKDKETEGSQYLKTAREDLQKIYRLLLERRLENEDLKAEKEALLQELGILQETCEQCEEKCQIKENQLSDEIDKIEAQIAGFKLRCTKCQQSTNTGEGRKHCADCPRCAEDRECLYKDGECHLDSAVECVCIATKQKLMDNVFDNMYSILEQQAKTPAGKKVADAVLDSLQKSRNGKLSDATRKRIHEFVLASVKKNLNLTVIGGAVKTRCEMDQDTYKQLMLCLNKVKEPTPSKADKNVSKIEPCTRWEDSSECHCPAGPKGCICTKAGKPQDDSRKLSSSGSRKDKQQDVNIAKCPHRESKSVMERDVHAVPCQVGREVASWRQSPCNDNKCSFSKNMRAAQCVLGPESLNDPPWTKMPHVPEISVLEDQIVCKCGPTPAKPCTCRDVKYNARQQIIEEVMGNYTDVLPIQKVTAVDEDIGKDLKKGENKERHPTLETFTNEAIKQNLSEINSNISFYPSSHTADLIKCKEISKIKQLSICNKRKKCCAYSKETNKNKLIKQQDFKKVIFNKKEKKPALAKYPVTTNTNIKNAIDSHWCFITRKPKYYGKKTESRISIKSKYGIKDKNNKNTDFTAMRKGVGLRVKQFIKSLGLKVATNKCQNNSSDIGWTNAKSLLKEISLITRTNDRTVTAIENEIEINNELLNIDDTKPNNKKIQNSVPSNLLYEREQGPLVIKDSINTTINCLYLSTKHLKTGVEQCDVSTCESIRAQAIKGLQPHEENMKTIKAPEHIKRVSEENTDFQINERLQRRKNTLQTIEDSSEQLQRSSTKYEDDNRRRSLDSKVFKKPHGKRNHSGSSHKHEHSSELKKTPSGALALELNKKVVRKIEEKLKDHQTVQAHVKKSDSGQFVIDFNLPKKSKSKIFVFKKSQSGSLLMDKYENSEEDNSVEEKASIDSKYSVSVAVILDAPGQNETKQSQINLSKKSTVVDVNKVPKHVCHHHHNVKKKSCLQNAACRNIKENDMPKFFKLKIKDSQEDLDCSLAVLEATKSDNFILNVDKEYEKQYKKAMRQEFDCDFECPVELSKTLSGHILIDFLENKDNVTVPNAVLKRSCSGNIKIRRDFLKPNISKSLSSDGKKASFVFSNLMSHFPVLKKESLKAPNLTHKRSTSDSHLLEKAKMHLQSQQQILSESSKLMKQSESGHYAVILNKNSKKAFIHSLKNYVSGNSQGKLPMKRTSKGEIIIKLNNDNDETNQFDSLKISPSGNIYVLVDEDFLKKCNIDDISEEQIFKQAAQNTQDGENKSVTTTCNAMPDTTCDSSKCVCGEVLRHGEDESNLEYFDAKCVSSFKFCSVDDNNHDCKKNKCHYKSPDRYSEGLLNMEVQKHNSPQCTCSPKNERKMSDDPQLFYMYQSICPFHKDRYDTVSNELLEITGLCNKVDIAPKIDKEDVNGDDTPKVKSSVVSSLPAESDYLDFLPPQLPPFLKGFRCM